MCHGSAGMADRFVPDGLGVGRFRGMRENLCCPPSESFWAMLWWDIGVF